MSYTVGLVGKPSVGKSTFFNAATMNDVPEGAYPFTTIDPSVGEAYVRVDCAAPEFDTECTPSVGYCDDGTRFVPVKLVDVAGLIPGAHEGNGLGNQFLTDLNTADALVHVVDFSGETDAEGEPTTGHDPREDIDFLEDELDQWYLEILRKGLEKYADAYDTENTDVEAVLAEQLSAFGTNDDELKRLIRRCDLSFDPATWSQTDEFDLARAVRQATKPILVAANKMDTPEAQANWAEITTDPAYDHLTFVPASAHAEKALKRARDAGVVEYTPGDDGFDVVGDPSPDQREGLAAIEAFIDEYGTTGVQDAIERALFDVVGVIPVFPGTASGGADPEGEFRDCFLLPEGSTTDDFAHHIHSDIGDGLLHGIDCRDGRQVGGDHELTPRDVIELVTTA